MDEIADLIRRQCEFLDSQQGPDYLRYLRHTWRTLMLEPRVRPLLLDMNREGLELVDAYRAHDNELVRRLRDLRTEFVRLFPDADDSSLAKPEGRDPLLSAWARSLAHFDEIASRPDDNHDDRPITALGLDDSTRAGKLARLLRSKLQALPVDAGEVGAQLSDIEQEHSFRHREFVNDRLTNPSTAVDLVIHALNQMNRAPLLGPMSIGQLLNEGMRRWGTGDAHVEEYLYEKQPTHDARVHGENLLATLRPALKRIEQELLLRIGRRRSLLTLLERYRTRCEWHDRDRLRRVAASARRRAEQVLTDELSRWLFDQGLTPLSKPLTGGLQPDLLDPAKLYVEAKRYRGAHGSRDHIVQGMWQVHDTIARLKGTPHAVQEAFYVVFREAGPRYSLPASVAGEGYMVFTILVDIAPLALSGSRQRQQPILIPADQLAPRDVPSQKVPPAATPGRRARARPGVAARK
jgi:hypothetical protein